MSFVKKPSNTLPIIPMTILRSIQSKRNVIPPVEPNYFQPPTDVDTSAKQSDDSDSDEEESKSSDAKLPKKKAHVLIRHLKDLVGIDLKTLMLDSYFSSKPKVIASRHSLKDSYDSNDSDYNSQLSSEFEDVSEFLSNDNRSVMSDVDTCTPCISTPVTPASSLDSGDSELLYDINTLIIDRS